MRLLVTGGCGFVGSVLCRLLLEKGGHEIVVLDDGSHALAYPPSGVQHLRQDVCLVKPDDIFAISPDVIVHLAARCSLPEGEILREEYFNTNISGTFALATALRRSGIGAHFVYAGSSAQPANPKHLAISWYGWTKDVAEQAARRILPKERFTCLRLFNVAGGAYGLREAAGPYGRLIPNTVNAIRRGTRLTVRGKGSTVRDFVHVFDVARAFLAAIERRPEGTFEIGSGVGTSVEAVIRRVVELMGCPVQLLEDGSLANAEETCVIADIQAAREGLGWKPSMTLDDCIRSVAEA